MGELKIIAATGVFCAAASAAMAHTGAALVEWLPVAGVGVMLVVAAVLLPLVDNDLDDY